MLVSGVALPADCIIRTCGKLLGLLKRRFEMGLKTASVLGPSLFGPDGLKRGVLSVACGATFFTELTPAASGAPELCAWKTAIAVGHSLVRAPTAPSPFPGWTRHTSGSLVSLLTVTTNTQCALCRVSVWVIRAKIQKYPNAHMLNGGLCVPVLAPNSGRLFLLWIVARMCGMS